MRIILGNFINRTIYNYMFHYVYVNPLLYFTPNTTSRDKIYKLTFTSNYYKPYIWSFVQRHAIEGTLTWHPQDLIYDRTKPLTETTVQIAKAEGTLTPRYEITDARLILVSGGSMTSKFQSILNEDTGVLNMGQISSLAAAKYTITMKISGISNETYIKPSSFQPIEGSFTLTVK